MSMMKRFFEYCIGKDPELEKAVSIDDYETVEKIMRDKESDKHIIEEFLKDIKDN